MAKRSCNSTSRVLQFFLLVSGPRLRHRRHRPPTAVPSARQQTRHETARLTRWSTSCRHGRTTAKVDFEVGWPPFEIKQFLLCHGSSCSATSAVSWRFAMREASGNAPVTCGAMRECLRREVLLSAATLPHSHTGELGPPQSRWTISPDTPMLRAKRVGSHVRWLEMMEATKMSQMQIPDWTASPANDCVQGPLGCKGI